MQIEKRINSIVGGLGKGNYQTDLKEKFQHKGKEYRIDIEIWSGNNNFRY
jgi:hypothetical protein